MGLTGLVVAGSTDLPPILAGHESPLVLRKARDFYLSVAQMFEAWVSRSPNRNTQRAYRTDIMSLVKILGIDWPDPAGRLLTTSIADVREWRSSLAEDEGFAPKTLNRRISSVSSFF
jgi:site-specific recombinase XerD